MSSLNFSEKSKIPRFILVSPPANNLGLARFSKQDVKPNNFTSVTNASVLNAEHDYMCHELSKAGIEVVNVYSFLTDDQTEMYALNPNSIFVRDPIITLPWSPDTAIICNMKLAGRSKEPGIMRQVAEQIGIKSFIQPPKNIYFEGGDVVATYEDRKHVVYIGIGTRTSKKAAEWLAKTLIEKNLADEVVCLRHKKKFLHLDTCFGIFPNKTIVYAHGSLRRGFKIDKALKKQSFDSTDYLIGAGYQLIPIPSKYAIEGQGCNMLHIGANKYLSFELTSEIKYKIEQTARINVIDIKGSEISKANGGVHCLTRQIY